MISTVYLLDANVFIEAAKRYYAFDLVPLFWAYLIDYADAGYIQSIDRVKKQLKRGNDDLAGWATGEFDSAFASTDEEDVIDAYTDIITWAQRHGQFSDRAKADFARTENADAWLVAYAKVNGCVIVTQEQPAPESKKIKIPDVSVQFNVAYVNTFEMLRELGVCLS